MDSESNNILTQITVIVLYFYVHMVEDIHIQLVS